MSWNKSKIVAGPVPPGHAKHIPSQTVPDGQVLFSFRHIDFSNDKFATADCKENYLQKFLERLRDVCGMLMSELRTNKSKSLRAHGITWADTAQPTGFTTLNSQLSDCDAFQFELTQAEHGRVHGFLLHNTFYVVWIDPLHNLYPRK